MIDIANLKKESGTQFDYELIVPDNKFLSADNLKYFNENQYIYTGELLEVEFEQEGEKIEHKNIYYFRRLFF